MHIVLSTHRAMRMDLNQKTMVSQGYCTWFVNCRHTNLQTGCHTICTNGYWKKLGMRLLMAKKCNLFPTLKVTNLCSSYTFIIFLLKSVAVTILKADYY